MSIEYYMSPLRTENQVNKYINYLSQFPECYKRTNHPILESTIEADMLDANDLLNLILIGIDQHSTLPQY